MKTFLKIFLVAVLLLVALKLSPVIFLAAVAGLLIAILLGGVGLSLLLGLVAVCVALTVALAPIWIPVLVIVGVVSLFKKGNVPPVPPVIAA